MARVIISAGHTQKEPGAVVQELREVDLTRKIATNVTQKLRAKGIITLSTPPELDLAARVDWINKTGYKGETEDIAIEFHINDGGKSGLEGWHKDKVDNKSKELTTCIIEEACKKANLENQGVKSEYDHPLKTLAFVHNTNTTSSLIECLYLDNPKDQEFLKDDSKISLLADGIVNGILKFFGILDEQPNINIQTPQPTTLPTTMPGSTYSPPPMPSYPQYTTPSPRPAFGQTPTFGAPTTTPQPQQSREERSKVIKDKYQQILGRKVNDQDLNYFLNLGLTEDQMIRRLVESQEHVDIIKNHQDCKKIKPKYEKLISENQKLKNEVKDKEELLSKQNQLIGQKNASIQSLEHATNASLTPQPTTTPPTPAPTQPQTEQQSPPPTIPNQSVGYQTLTPPKESFIDKTLRKLNDIFD
jgi:N-acetylmuramoyl-L-alanine amidase